MFGWLKYQISLGTAGIVISVLALSFAYLAYIHETSLEKRMNSLDGQVVALTDEVQHLKKSNQRVREELAPDFKLLPNQGHETSLENRVNRLENEVGTLTDEVQHLTASNERLWRELTPHLKLLRDDK